MWRGQVRGGARYVAGYLCRQGWAPAAMAGTLHPSMAHRAPKPPIPNVRTNHLAPPHPTPLPHIRALRATCCVPRSCGHPCARTCRPASAAACCAASCTRWCPQVRECMQLVGRGAVQAAGRGVSEWAWHDALTCFSLPHGTLTPPPISRTTPAPAASTYSMLRSSKTSKAGWQSAWQQRGIHFARSHVGMALQVCGVGCRGQSGGREVAACFESWYCLAPVRTLLPNSSPSAPSVPTAPTSPASIPPRFCRAIKISC